MTQAISDIYEKIADIYDKICDLPSDKKSEVEYVNPYDENTYTPPYVFLANPDSDEDISQAETEINSAISLVFQVVRDEDTVYFSSLGNGDIVPTPKGGSLIWLPKLIAILVGYSAPISFITSLIIDFLKEILLEEIKNRLKRKTQVIFRSLDISDESLFVIPWDADGMLIQIGNIPDWMGKRFDNLDNVSTERYTVLGSISLGYVPEFSNDYYWKIDELIRFKHQWIDIKPLEDIKNKRALLKFDYSLSASIHFVKNI